MRKLVIPGLSSRADPEAAEAHSTAEEVDVPHMFATQKTRSWRRNRLDDR
jgi:hypothetical protein